MELKKNNDNINQGPQGGTPSGNYYSQRDMMSSAYGNTAPGAQGQFGNAPRGNVYTGPQGGSPYSQPQQTSPYGGGFNGGSPYPQRGQSAFDGGATTIQQKSGINPLVIIIPILVLFAVIGVSQFKRLFGDTNYVPGKLESDVLTNEYFGFEANYKGWDVTGYSGSAESEISELKANKPVMELTAQKKMGAEAFNFGVKKTPYNIKESGTNFTKLIEEYQTEYKSQLSAQGYEVESIKQEKMTVAGKTCDGYIITGKFTSGGQTVKICAAQFFMIKGTYISVFTGVATSEGGAKNAIVNHVKEYRTTD